MINSNILNYIKIDKNAMMALIVAIVIFIIEIFLLDIEEPTMSICLAYDIDFIVLYGFIYFVIKEHSLFNFYSLFWLSVSLFSFGHVILFSLGLDAPIRFIFETYPLKIVNEYMIYGFASFIFLFFSLFDNNLKK